MAIDYLTLKQEYTTGSFANTLYSTYVSTRDYNTLAQVTNTRGLTGSSITIGILTAYEIQRLVVGSEYLTLTQAQRDLWGTLMVVAQAQQGLAVSDTNIRGQVLVIWSAGLSNTRNNLISAQTRLCSRAESLFGENTVVTPTDAYVALTQ